MSERIKQALDRARLQRRGSGSTESVVTSAANTVAPPPSGNVVPVSSDWLEQHRLLTADMPHEIVHAYKVLRTQVLNRMREHGWRTLAVVSPGPNDGKTLTALNLGISLVADRSQTVLVVEFDLRMPSIAARFGIPPLQLGVDDVLEGRGAIADAISRIGGIEGLEGFSLLLARQARHNSSELLASPQTAALVADLKASDPQRIIIFDLPPALAYDDALRFAPLVDAILVVVTEGRTRRADIRRVVELFPKTPVIGTVLNGSHERSAGYYYSGPVSG